MFKGIKELIETLNNNNTLYILSTLDLKILIKHSKETGILKNFKKIIGNASNKIKALEKHLIDEKLIPSETIFIGDMPHDIESAKKLKVQSAGVTYGYSNPETINSTNPDYIFHNSNEIQDHFIKINQSTPRGGGYNKEKESISINLVTYQMNYFNKTVELREDGHEGHHKYLKGACEEIK